MVKKEPNPHYVAELNDIGNKICGYYYPYGKKGSIKVLLYSIYGSSFANYWKGRQPDNGFWIIKPKSNLVSAMIELENTNSDDHLIKMDVHSALEFCHRAGWCENLEKAILRITRYMPVIEYTDTEIELLEYKVSTGPIHDLFIGKKNGERVLRVVVPIRKITKEFSDFQVEDFKHMVDCAAKESAARIDLFSGGDQTDTNNKWHTEFSWE